ncbi:MAG: exodeoxyribonuclease VII large subunit [Mameliella sp.]|nr:exodeoxyribonuclease VII large subunit [Phaeodactylibacter sp.]
MEKHTLFKLNEYVRRIIALNLPAPVWVSCEIYQLNYSRGHHFLSLVQKADHEDEILAQSDAVLWQKQFRKLEKKLGRNLRHLLQEGTEVLIQARVDFNERYGMKLIVEDFDLSYTIGQLQQQRQMTLDRLKAEKLLGLNSKKNLPLVPHRLAIISSPTAAGLEDFLRQLEHNEFGYKFQVRVFPAAMQGINAPGEITRQIEQLQNLTRSYDAIIITRGGGARLDLAAFDDYDLCAAIAQCPIPVLTGIGHEIDEVLSDLVAHTALKTPTAVAEFLIDRALRVESRLNEFKYAIATLAQQQFSSEKLKLERWANTLPLLSQHILQQQAQNIERWAQTIAPLASHKVQLQQQQLLQLEQLVDLLSPEATLKRGYTLTTKADGKPISSASSVKKGTLITTQFSDGTLKSKVQ